MSTEQRVYNGVLQVRTDRTMGPPVEEVIAAARHCGLDFIVLSDVKEASEARRLRGWHDGVLVLIAEEVHCDDGSFLACDARKLIGEIPLVDAALSKTREEEGAALGFHYEFQNGRERRSLPAPLPLMRTDLFALWSFFDDYLVHADGRFAMQYLHRPDKALEGPARRLLREWDAVLKDRPLPAVGTVNARLRRDPLLDWKELFPYELAFKTIRTAVVCDELPEDPRVACGKLWQALRIGSSWIYNFTVGDASTAVFAYISDDGSVAHVGETVPSAGKRRGWIDVRLPAQAEVVLRRNGHPLFWGGADKLNFPSPGDGVYRLEARVDGRPWLFTNSIRVGMPSGLDEAVVEEFT